MKFITFLILFVFCLCLINALRHKDKQINLNQLLGGTQTKYDG